MPVTNYSERGNGFTYSTNGNGKPYNGNPPAVGGLPTNPYKPNKGQLIKNLNDYYNTYGAGKDDDTPKGYSGSGSSGYDYSEWFRMMMDLADAKYQAEAKANKEAWRRKDDIANRNYMRNRRDWERAYSNIRNGQGLSNRFNITSNRDSALRDNRSEFDTAMANANANRYDTLYNMTSMLPQMDATTLQKIMQNVASRGM